MQNGARSKALSCLEKVIATNKNRFLVKEAIAFAAGQERWGLSSLPRSNVILPDLVKQRLIADV